MKSASEFHALDQMIRRNEGVRPKMYKDSLGIPTVGIGFNLLRADARERLAAVGVELDDVKAGKALTDDEMSRLLRYELDVCVDDLRTLLHLDALPLDAQLVLVDLRYNLGPTKLRKFVTTLEEFRKGRFKGAARWLEASTWARQVGVRAKRSIEMLRRLPNGDHVP
jgi:GH24 family phage-related lysozyme (muramidase)